MLYVPALDIDLRNQQSLTLEDDEEKPRDDNNRLHGLRNSDLKIIRHRVYPISHNPNSIGQPTGMSASAGGSYASRVVTPQYSSSNQIVDANKQYNKETYSTQTSPTAYIAPQPRRVQKQSLNALEVAVNISTSQSRATSSVQSSLQTPKQMQELKQIYTPTTNLRGAYLRRSVVPPPSLLPTRSQFEKERKRTIDAGLYSSLTEEDLETLTFALSSDIDVPFQRIDCKKLNKRTFTQPSKDQRRRGGIFSSESTDILDEEEETLTNTQLQARKTAGSTRGRDKPYLTYESCYQSSSVRGRNRNISALSSSPYNQLESQSQMDCQLTSNKHKIVNVYGSEQLNDLSMARKRRTVTEGTAASPLKFEQLPSVTKTNVNSPIKSEVATAQFSKQIQTRVRSSMKQQRNNQFIPAAAIQVNSCESLDNNQSTNHNSSSFGGTRVNSPTACNQKVNVKPITKVKITTSLAIELTEDAKKQSHNNPLKQLRTRTHVSTETSRRSSMASQLATNPYSSLQKSIDVQPPAKPNAQMSGLAATPHLELLLPAHVQNMNKKTAVTTLSQPVININSKQITPTSNNQPTETDSSRRKKSVVKTVKIPQRVIQKPQFLSAEGASNSSAQSTSNKPTNTSDVSKISNSSSSSVASDNQNLLVSDPVRQRAIQSQQFSKKHTLEVVPHKQYKQQQPLVQGGRSHVVDVNKHDSALNKHDQVPNKLNQAPPMLDNRRLSSGEDPKIYQKVQATNENLKQNQLSDKAKQGVAVKADSTEDGKSKLQQQDEDKKTNEPTSESQVEEIVKPASRQAWDLSEEEWGTYGDRFPKSLIKKKLLGRGGFALVWLGEDKTTSEQYALKQIQSRNQHQTHIKEIWFGSFFFKNGQPKEKFAAYRGINNLSRMIKFDIRTVDTWIYYELCGESLGSCLFELKGDGYLNDERIFRVHYKRLYEIIKKDHNQLKKLIYELAHALWLLSDHRIVHSDLKTENILISINSEKNTIDQVKLIDYGSSFTFGNLKHFSMATPEYMAPEILNYILYQNKLKHQPKLLEYLSNYQQPHVIDVWSLGCVVMEIINGIPLWMSLKTIVKDKEKEVLRQGLFASKGRVFEKIVEKQMHVVANLNTYIDDHNYSGVKVDEDIKFLVKSMLALDPKQRISPKEICQFLHKTVFPDSELEEHMQQLSKVI